MKKLIILLVIAILFSASFSAFAGDIPESLLNEDSAKLYIGRVDGRTTLAESTLPYEENKVIYIDITPVFKYKGDVQIGVSERHKEHNFGSFIPEKNKEYLFAYLDENNFYIYEIEEWDEKTIRLVDSDKYDMTKRLEVYLNDGGFKVAEEERLSLGKQMSFAEFLYTEPVFSDEEVKKVTLRYQDELCEINKDEFFKIAEDITVTNVKNDTLYDVKVNHDTTDAYKTVLYVELFDANDRVVNFGAVSRFGEVDKYSLSMGRLMAKDYEMNPEDLSKLYSLFPEDVQKDIISPESLPASDENLPLELPSVPEKNYTGLAVGIAVAVFVIAFVVGFTIRKKKK